MQGIGNSKKMKREEKESKTLKKCIFIFIYAYFFVPLHGIEYKLIN